MKITRREFLKTCGVAAAAIGLTSVDLAHLEEVLANPNGPSVLWLQGAACTGCSVSFLNRVSSSAPLSAASVLTDSINLVYHPNIMSLAGQSAVDEVRKVYNAGGYILAVEGGVPAAFSGGTCYAWTDNGEDVTFIQAVSDLAARASTILCIGTCAAWGGMAAAPPNPTRVKGVSEVTGRSTINIAGCPPHPDWIVGVIAQLLLGNSIPLDSRGRPTQFFSAKLHENCPRHENDEVNTFGVDNRCLKKLGCRGPVTRCNCHVDLWNNRQNWCIDANAPCIGCTNYDFPTGQSFRAIFDD